MSTRSYIVTYIAADGSQKTESVVARNHVAVERIIKKNGGTVLHLDREDSEPKNIRPLKHVVEGALLFVAAAILVILYFWYKFKK